MAIPEPPASDAFRLPFQHNSSQLNSVCPGWVKTDMGGQEAERAPEGAAEGIVWLATLPDGGPTGGFFRDKEPIEW
jgi:hypothetical protein